MEKKLALVLSGGGLKGAYQAGAIVSHVLENGLPDMVAGISVGALNGSMVASGKVGDLFDLWRGVHQDPSTIFEDGVARMKDGRMKLSLMPVVWGFFKRNGQARTIWQLLRKDPSLEGKFLDYVGLGLMGNSGLRRVLEENLSDNLLMDFLVNFVSLGAGGDLARPGMADYATREDRISGVLASTTMPGVWAPVPEVRMKDGSVYEMSVDSGIRDTLPLPHVMQYIRDNREFDWHVKIISCQNRRLAPLKYGSIVDVIASTVEVMLNENYTNDLEELIKKSRKADTDPRLVSVSVSLVEPEPGQLGGTLDATNILTNFNLGLAAQEITLDY